MLRAKKTDATVEALGHSHGGTATKVHAVVDVFRNPLLFILTPGQLGDNRTGRTIGYMLQARSVIGDKGFDSDRFIAYIEALEAKAVIPPKEERDDPA